MESDIRFLIGFALIVVTILALDLGVFNRNSHRVTVREATVWSIVWISLALLFNFAIYLFKGTDQALAFFAGYLLEYSLSVDNIFVFVLIFSYFSVPVVYQHRVLFWGILTAVVLRGSMILLGAALLTRFEFLITLFGAFLVYTAIRMAQGDDTSVDVESNPLVNLLRRFMPITDGYRDQHFTVFEAGRQMATPLLIVLLVVESTDVVFAVDSIPAIFGITTDSFIVFTSNIFAILGLRSLYFLLAGVIDKFHYLQVGLSIVLGFVGIKMLIESISAYTMSHPIHFPIQWSLLFIGLVLTSSVVASLLFPKHEHGVPIAES
ncbi:MAG: TerC family protein [Caldilineaceae bacterium]|nr:TerC family protein [Caldilineaceae bacterium]